MIGRTEAKSDFIVDLTEYGIREKAKGQIWYMTIDRRKIGANLGDYYVIADSDDAIEENKLKECKYYIGNHINRKNPSERVYYFRVYI